MDASGPRKVGEDGNSFRFALTSDDPKNLVQENRTSAKVISEPEFANKAERIGKKRVYWRSSTIFSNPIMAFYFLPENGAHPCYCGIESSGQHD